MKLGELLDFCAYNHVGIRFEFDQTYMVKMYRGAFFEVYYGPKPSERILETMLENLNRRSESKERT